MASSDRKNPLLDQIRRMAALQQLRQMPDRELLVQFVGQGNEAAFRALMDRYGSMVLRVCKRILGNDHDAEDAYQAVFLVLARKADSQCGQESVAAWLYGVSVRVARKARQASQRRRRHEQLALEKKTSNPLVDLSMREAYDLLDEEIVRLPEKYRTPLIQCQLMGRRQDEMARELGCSLRTLTLRLERGKDLLQKRLAARGVTVTGILLSLMLSSASEAVAVPPILLANTFRAVLLFVQGQKVVAASPAVTYLAEMVVKGMLFAQMRTRVLVVVLTLVLAGGGLGTWRVAVALKPEFANPPTRQPANPPTATAARIGVEKPAQPEAAAKIAGPSALIHGKVVGADERAVPFAEVAALVRRPFRPGEKALWDEVVAQGKTDAQGTFRLRVPADFPTWFPERLVTLTAKAPGGAPVTKIIRFAEQGATEVELQLTAAERVVRGCLLTPDGEPASGVRLRVIRLGDVARETRQGVTPQNDRAFLGWPEPVVSDAEGCFALRGIDPEQGLWLQVEDERYAPEAFELQDTDKPAKVRLKPAQVLEGRVIAADTGQAVDGVALTAWQFGQMSTETFMVPEYLKLSSRVLPLGTIDAVSEADGRFRLRPPVGKRTFIEIHPPLDSPYLGVRKEVRWPEGVVQQRLVVALPRGVMVSGQVVDQDGHSVPGASVQAFSRSGRNPGSRSELMEAHERIVRTGKDGRFRLTAPAGAVQLAAHGPTHEYQVQVLHVWRRLAEAPESWGWRAPLPGERRESTHAAKQLQLTLAEHLPEVRLRLVRGETVAGRVVGPDGAPVKSAMLLCGEKVSPLHPSWVHPLPVREGRYELPGCVAGRVYPVLFLDAVNGWGAAVDLTAGRGEGPEVKLARCGSARVRLVNAKGRPLARRWLPLRLLTERSFSAATPPLERESDWQPEFWYDPRNYPHYKGGKSPMSDAEGWLTLPALIPGARYTFDRDAVIGITPEFQVEPGQQLQLPDLTIRVRE